MIADLLSVQANLLREGVDDRRQQPFWLLGQARGPRCLGAPIGGDAKEGVRGRRGPDRRASGLRVNAAIAHPTPQGSPVPLCTAGRLLGFRGLRRGIRRVLRLRSDLRPPVQFPGIL